MPLTIKRLGPTDADALNAAVPCFDQPIRADAAHKFLHSEGHHVLLAYDGEDIVGFVTGVEMTHPDKGTEMFLYELGVRDAHRGRGYGTKLVQALAELARKRQCYGMWVATEHENNAALATYDSAGARRQSSFVLLGWDFEEP